MAIVSHPANKEYLSNYDSVFKKKPKEEQEEAAELLAEPGPEVCPTCGAPKKSKE